MKTFAIHEDRMGRLEKKLDSLKKDCPHADIILNKIGLCKKMFCDTIKMGKKEATYVSMSLKTIMETDDWQVIAYCEMDGDVMKVKHCFADCSLPCDTFANETGENSILLANLDTGEFLQVGESQIGEYLEDISLEEVKKVVAFYDFVEKLIHRTPLGMSEIPSYDTKEILRYFVALCHVEGFVKEDIISKETFSTPSKVLHYYDILHDYRLDENLSYDDVEKMKMEMEENGFDPEALETYEIVENALAWLFSDESPKNDFYQKMRSIACLPQIDRNHFKTFMYTVINYKKTHIDECQYMTKESEWQGEIGDKLYIPRCSFISFKSDKNYFPYLLIDYNDNRYFVESKKPIKTAKYFAGTVIGHDYDNRGNKRTKLIDVYPIFS